MQKRKSMAEHDLILKRNELDNDSQRMDAIFDAYIALAADPNNEGLINLIQEFKIKEMASLIQLHNFSNATLLLYRYIGNMMSLIPFLSPQELMSLYKSLDFSFRKKSVELKQFRKFAKIYRDFYYFDRAHGEGLGEILFPKEDI